METGDLIKGRYELVRFLGSGSFGEVWQAHDRMIGKDVALKIYLTLDPAGVDEFKREYANTLDLSSPYLLTPHYFDVWERRPFLVMKYCERGSSAKLAGHITENELWKFVHDVAAGLDVLHSQQEPMVHQDIKPDNILVDGDGCFLITDFGISKQLRATMRKQSSHDMTSGATPYMAPERFESTAMLSTASDVWSLGASIYELATGELPFSGFGGGMQRSGAEMPSLDGNWSADLNRLMQSCLARNASERPTAKQVADLSDGILNGKPVLHVGEATGKGWTYQGELLDGTPHGKGIMHFDNGNTYEGDFVNGNFNGQGKLVWANGGYYEGNFKDNNFNGQGKLVWANGGYYEGNFKDNNFNGQGKLLYTDGGYHEGNWKDGERDGRGKYVRADGEYYEGKWRDGKDITAEWLRENTTIGGWLLLPLLTLLLGGLAVLAGGGSLAWMAFTELEGWSERIFSILGACFLLWISFVLINPVVAFYKRKPNAVKYAKRVFAVPMCIWVWVLCIEPLDRFKHWDTPWFGVVFWGVFVVWSVFWIWYLDTSKQVRKIIPPVYRENSSFLNVVSASVMVISVIGGCVIGGAIGGAIGDESGYEHGRGIGFAIATSYWSPYAVESIIRLIRKKPTKAH